MAKNRKAAAQRKGSGRKTTTKRYVNPLTRTLGGGRKVPTLGGGVAFRPRPLTNAQSGGERPGATPTLNLPNGGAAAVVPIAPPPVDPFLTPTDEANQALEESSWDQYLGNLDLQVQQAEADTALRVGDIDRALGKGLDSTDWNMAARGLQASSIKDQAKIDMQTQAAANKGAANQQLTNLQNNQAEEHKRIDTVVKPAIAKKYADLRVRNAQAISDSQAPPPDAPVDPGMRTISVTGNEPTTLNKPKLAAGAPTVISSSAQPTTGNWVTRMKGGKMWLYNTKTHAWKAL